MDGERRGKRIDDLPGWARRLHEKYGSPELSGLNDVFHGPLIDRKSGLRKDDIIEVLLDARALPEDVDPWVRGVRWIGVIESPPPSGCEPDSNGLTACTADDFEFVAGGDSERDGSMVFQLKSGDYRFATASTDTSGLGGKQLVTITPEVSLNPAAEILLGIVAVLLFAGSGEMFAHNRILQAWQRFKEA